MKLFPTLAGNEKIKKTLAQDIKNGKHSHAYIIEGPKGSGKHTIAYLAAAALSCTSTSECLPCGKCNSCRKTFDKINTDIIVISKGTRATLGVDSIRQIKDTLKLAPVEMKYKVYIIEDADKMTKSAQNALLLSLEEPPEYVVFFLLCENSLLMLDTVKSRAPILCCELFEAEFVKRYLADNEVYSKIADEAPQRFDEACVASHGSIGAAISFLDPKLSNEIHSERERIEEAVKGLCTSSSTARLESLSLYPTSRSEVTEFLSRMLFALRDLLYVKRGGGKNLMFFTSFDSAFEIAKKAGVGRLLEIEKSLIDAVNDISLNLSVNAVLTILVTK